MVLTRHSGALFSSVRRQVQGLLAAASFRNRLGRCFAFSRLLVALKGLLQTYLRHDNDPSSLQIAVTFIPFLAFLFPL